MALVQNLDAQLGGGRLKANGQWKPGNAGWTLRGDLANVDGVFDRWEARVAGHADAGNDVTPDAFARGLADEEEQASLVAELEALSQHQEQA